MKVAIIGSHSDMGDVLPNGGFGGRLLHGILNAVETDDNIEVLVGYSGNLAPIKDFQPDCVVALGESVFNAIHPPTGETFFASRGQEYMLNGIRIIPTFRPVYVLQRPNFFLDFANDIQKALKPRRPPINPDVIVIESYEQLQYELNVVRKYSKIKWNCAYQSRIAIDIETTGLDFRKDFVRAFGFAVSRHAARIIPEALIRDERCYNTLKKFVEFECEPITHNGISFDDPFIENAWEIHMETKHDTMLMHYALDERQGTHGLDDLAKTYYGMPNYKSDVRGQGYAGASTKSLYRMLAIDCCLTYALYDEILEKTCKAEGFKDLLLDHIQPAARALSIMEQTGVTIDVPYLQSVGNTFSASIYDMIKQLRIDIDNPDFNPNSPKQVAELVYREYKWKPWRREGNTTRAPILEKIMESKDPDSAQCRNVRTIIDIKQKMHLKSTYVEGIIKRLDDDGRIRTNLKIIGTQTGRLASSDPNLQNIPQLMGPVIRDAFVASEGYTLIEGDYSQLELRVGAWYSKDPAYTQAFIDNVDIHASVAAEIYGIPVEQVTHNQRHFAKYFNFGLPYGRGDDSMAQQMGKPLAEAQAFHRAWDKKYAVHKKWMDGIKAEAIREGELKSSFGRVRRFPLVTDDNKAEIEREALNFPVQSMASDICLGSIVRMSCDMLEGMVPASYRLLLTVHDSVLIEVPDDQVQDACRWMKNVMEDVPITAPYPWLVEIKTGRRWGSLEKWKGE